LAAAGYLTGQLTEFPGPDLGSLTSTAVLGWYAWHTATRTVPGLVKDFRDEMSAARLELRDERLAFYDQLREERRLRHDDSVAVVEALSALTTRCTSVSRAEDKKAGGGS
jgi:hypothetical protein